jgi:murein L,D-transpeptidase YafK
MKAAVSFFITATLLVANGFDYAKAYLDYGVEAMEKLAEEQLATKEFWLSRLEGQNVEYGYFQNRKYENIVIVDKSVPKLKILDGNFTKLFETNAVIGEVLGDKMVEGDLKTPVGVYNFTRRIQHVDPFYGPLAIVTNYPNFYDKMHKKTGSGIWLHGYPLNEPFKNKTEGCVAVENEVLLQIDKMIDHKKALLITNESGVLTTNADEIATILAFVYRWRNAWKYDKYEQYLGMYDDAFMWYNKMDKPRFAEYKKRVFEIASNKQIEFSDFEVVPYPTSLYEDKVLQIKMRQDYSASNHRSSGIKTLFVKLNGTQPSIILEK